MRGDIDERLIETDAWTDEMVGAAGIPVIDVPLVTVGGGIGSFTLFDTLRIYGVPRRAMAVLSPQDAPWQSYEYLTRVSQIPRTERLRSDSGGMPENIWGFPSYAVREAIADKSLHPLWNVLAEPVFADYYTPRAGQVLAGMEREAKRIGFAQSLFKGQVRMVRKRRGGGYYTILTPPAGATRTKRIAFRSTYVHIAIGYPGLRLLPDLQAYREKYRDPTRVVNAYEPHEHVYQALQRRPGTVMVRGSGIVASRVLQRLIDDRDRLGLHTQILHLFRTYVAGPHGSSVFMRRKGGDGWAYQGFNWPKATWGGQLKTRLRKLEGRERAALLKTMGGTNTPARKLWQRQLARGRAEGWYQILAGEARDLRPDRTRPGVVTTIDPDRYAPLPFRPPERPFDMHADYVIDCTGLEADIREHRLLADLLVHTGARRNPLERLDVEPTFELIGARSAPGRLYASGSATLGGYYASVDSFLGLQYAASEIADDLARLGFCRRLHALRSVHQWWLWMLNKKLPE
ncbi:hypothetical protein LTV02_10380 [Nocardia yamanashiensis]|uniref:hypothetical protein n=1 Tax=Nocardia yamanashiensis TaxID=209247 RepID=UPI001E4551E2|nr:hypothetical protein [Nocardia yamanashiensis]UGT43756.1 hypothetical protein LTV02_10380 [Nocardia yamanashiensis]